MRRGYASPMVSRERAPVPVCLFVVVSTPQSEVRARTNCVRFGIEFLTTIKTIYLYINPPVSCQLRCDENPFRCAYSKRKNDRLTPNDRWRGITRGCFVWVTSDDGRFSRGDRSRMRSCAHCVRVRASQGSAFAVAVRARTRWWRLLLIYTYARTRQWVVRARLVDVSVVVGIAKFTVGNPSIQPTGLCVR